MANQVTSTILEWKPINTAPLDGTSILVCNENNYSPETASWRVYHPNLQGKPTWRNANGNKINPTHWQQLPTKPKKND